MYTHSLYDTFRAELLTLHTAMVLSGKALEACQRQESVGDVRSAECGTVRAQGSLNGEKGTQDGKPGCDGVVLF